MAENLKESETRSDTELSDRVDRVVQAARAHADQVDAEGRFPREAVNELKRQQLLGPEPRRSQGLWTAVQITAVGRRLGQACSSSGMVWAMHQGQLQGIARQVTIEPQVQEFLNGAWELQPLVSSLMSEVGAASPRESKAYCQDEGSAVRVDKNVSLSSYLQEADAGLVVVRRSAEDPLSDPALLLAMRAEMTISRWKPWQALGMRGTGSGGGKVSILVPRGRILTESFAELSARAITPITHLGWSACWSGIAESALAVAQSYVRRDQGRLAPDVATARLLRLGRASDRLDEMINQIEAVCRAYDKQWSTGEVSDSVTRRSNALRLSVASLAHDSVMDCFQVIGIDAYRDASASRFSLSRQIRDVLSSRVMISEDRIRLGSGAYAQLARLPEPLAFTDDERPRL